MTDAWDGRPANPERDGWHWIAVRLLNGEWAPAVHRWFARQNEWKTDAVKYGLAGKDVRYLGPVATPAEVAAQRDAAWRAGRDAAADAVGDATRAPAQRNAKDQWREDIGRYAIAAIRALQPPADLAAAAATCDAVAVEREACAALVESETEPSCAFWGRDDTARHAIGKELAAAIRARGRASA